MFAIITDNRGAIVEATSQYVPVNHRVQFEKGQIYGAENLFRRVSVAEWSAFIAAVSKADNGSYGDFSWVKE